MFRTLPYCEPETYENQITYIENQRHILNPGIFRNLACWEPETYWEHWDIQNPRILGTPIYSEPWHVQNLRHIQKHLCWRVLQGWLSYNYFHKSQFFLQYQLFTSSTLLNDFLKIYIQFLLQKYLGYVKQYRGQGCQRPEPWIFIYILFAIQSCVQTNV